MSVVDHAGRTPLHYAAMENKVDEVKTLVRVGVDPNRGDYLGFTALHLAAQVRALGASVALLDAGADIDAVNSHGNTPLFVAVFNSRGRGDLIGLFRERGADPRRVNDKGQSPLGLARLIGNFDVAQFFADIADY